MLTGSSCGDADQSVHAGRGRCRACQTLAMAGIVIRGFVEAAERASPDHREGS